MRRAWEREGCGPRWNRWHFWWCLWLDTVGRLSVAGEDWLQARQPPEDQ